MAKYTGYVESSETGRGQRITDTGVIEEYESGGRPTEEQMYGSPQSAPRPSGRYSQTQGMARAFTGDSMIAPSMDANLNLNVQYKNQQMMASNEYLEQTKAYAQLPPESRQYQLFMGRAEQLYMQKMTEADALYKTNLKKFQELDFDNTVSPEQTEIAKSQVLARSPIYTPEPVTQKEVQAAMPPTPDEVAADAAKQSDFFAGKMESLAEQEGGTETAQYKYYEGEFNKSQSALSSSMKARDLEAMYAAGEKEGLTKEQVNKKAAAALGMTSQPKQKETYDFDTWDDLTEKEQKKYIRKHEFEQRRKSMPGIFRANTYKKIPTKDFIARAKSDPEWFQSKYPQKKTRTSLPATYKSATKDERREAYQKYVAGVPAGSSAKSMSQFGKMVDSSKEGIRFYLPKRDF